jgi:hypothetical protein
MNETNMIALAKVIRQTQRFDMGVILGIYDPESDEVLISEEVPCPHDFWVSELWHGDYTAWANAIAEHEPLDDEDAAAAWLGLTISQFDRLSYTDGYEGLPSLWRKSSHEITPNMAADMLDRIRTGVVVFA